MLAHHVCAGRGCTSAGRVAKCRTHVGVGDEEELLLGEVRETGQALLDDAFVVLLPHVVRLERRAYAGIVGDVLAQRLAPVERLPARVGHLDCVVEVDEALGLVVEVVERRLVPPVAHVAVRVVVTTCAPRS